MSLITTSVMVVAKSVIEQRRAVVVVVVDVEVAGVIVVPVIARPVDMLATFVDISANAA